MLKTAILESNLIILAKQNLKKVVELSTAELSTVYPTPTGFICSDVEKYLHIFTVNEQLEATQTGKLYLPKKVTHSWVRNGKVFFCDKYGDINSVHLTKIKEAKPQPLPEAVILAPDVIVEEEQVGEEDQQQKKRPKKIKRPPIKKDFEAIYLESGNFSTATEAKLMTNSEGVEKLYLADEYYKIRIFNFENLHILETNISFRKRFVSSFQLYNNDLLMVFDDSRFFKITAQQLEESNNVSQIEIENPFPGQITLSGDNDHFVIIEDEHGRVHRCEIEDNKIAIKESLIEDAGSKVRDLGGLQYARINAETNEIEQVISLQ